MTDMDLVHDLVYNRNMDRKSQSRTVNIHEAKTHFSSLVHRVMAGEEVIIAKSGVPVARLVPIAPSRKERVAGSAKGKVRMASDFDALLPEEVLEQFEGMG